VSPFPFRFLGEVFPLLCQGSCEGCRRDIRLDIRLPILKRREKDNIPPSPGGTGWRVSGEKPSHRVFSRCGRSTRLRLSLWGRGTPPGSPVASDSVVRASAPPRHAARWRQGGQQGMATTQGLICTISPPKGFVHLCRCVNVPCARDDPACWFRRSRDQQYGSVGTDVDARGEGMIGDEDAGGRRKRCGGSPDEEDARFVNGFAAVLHGY